MTKTNSQKNIFASKDALAFWIPNRKEKQAINKRSHLEKSLKLMRFGNY